MLSHQPSWQVDQPKVRTYPPLGGTHTTDVVVIGGGITGVVSAYLLAKAGKKVILIEKDRLASGATGYTTAFLTRRIDTDLAELIDIFGRTTAQLVWESGQAAIDLFAQIIKDKKIDCEFMLCDSYTYVNDAADIDKLEAEQTLAKQLGFASQLVRESKLPIATPACLVYPDQAKFHPTKFIAALAAKAVELGATIAQQTEAIKVHSSENGVSVDTPDGHIEATDVIVATYAPFHNPPQVMARKGAYTTYVLELEFEKGTLPEAMYEDIENPYHYFRVDRQPDHDRVILGGEDHRQEFNFLEEKSFAKLQDYACQLFAGHQFRVMRQWQGQILEPTDGLPSIGRIRPHEYVATGFSGNGMTYGAIAAMIFRDQILGTKNPWTRVYKPTRVPTLTQLVTKGRDYVEENWNGAIKKMLKPVRSASKP